MEAHIEYSQIIGTWKLIQFSVINQNGQEVSWEGSCHGHLIYTPDYFVSAAINRLVGNERRDSLYTAKVTIRESSVLVHTILESSQPDRIGQSHERRAQLNGNQLVLSGKGPSGTIKISWERLS